MKKTSLYIGLTAALLVTAAAGFTSCRFEDDDYFEESASLRLEHYLDSAEAYLVAPENGWVMQYFCGTQNFQFEGFNLFAKFYESGKVLMASDHRMLRDGNAGVYTEDTSLYSLIQEDGPVLAFDTWNDILTVFADPVNPFLAPTTISNDGQGMNGDYNFVLMSLSEDKIQLVGERYRGNVRLVKCDMGWEEYIEATEEAKEVFTNSTITNYYITNSVDTMYICGLSAGKMLYCERIEDPLQQDSMACCFTPEGFYLEEAHEVGESSFQEFTLSADSSMLVSGDVECIAMWDDYVVGHTPLWYFSDDEYTDEMTEAFDDINSALQEYSTNYSLKSIALGKSTGGNAVNGIIAVFYTNASKSKTNSCGVAMNSTLTKYGQIELTVDDEPSYDANVTTIAKKSDNIKSAMKAFADIIADTYDMTPNNYFLPTGTTYASTTGGLTFTLAAE